MSDVATTVTLTDADLSEMGWWLDEEDEEKEDPNMEYIRSLISSKQRYFQKYHELARKHRKSEIFNKIKTFIMILIIIALCGIIFIQNRAITGNPIELPAISISISNPNSTVNKQDEVETDKTITVHQPLMYNKNITSGEPLDKLNQKVSDFIIKYNNETNGSLNRWYVCHN